jgi:hypothetical protein
MLRNDISVRVSRWRATIIWVGAVFAAVPNFLHWRAIMLGLGAIAFWSLAIVGVEVTQFFFLIFIGCLLWAGALITQYDAWLSADQKR